MELRYPTLVGVGAAIAIIGALVVYRLVSARSHASAEPVANTSLLTRLPEYRRALRRHRIRMLVLAGSATLLGGAALIGAARPVDVTIERPETRNRDVVLCLDISGSMAAYDAELVRTFMTLVTQFEGERIGLVIFNSSAATVFPLTDDYDFIHDELDIALRALAGDPEVDYFFAGTFNGLGTSLIGDGLTSCVSSFDRVDTRRAHRQRARRPADHRARRGDRAGQAALRARLRSEPRGERPRRAGGRDARLGQVDGG